MPLVAEPVGIIRGLVRRSGIAASTPLKRIVEPNDVAEAVLACVMLKANTGGRIIVDGGRFLT